MQETFFIFSKLWFRSSFSPKADGLTDRGPDLRNAKKLSMRLQWVSECQRLSCECIQVLFRVGTGLKVNGVVSRKPLVKFTMRTFNFVSVCVCECVFPLLPNTPNLERILTQKLRKLLFVQVLQMFLFCLTEVYIDLWRNSSAKNNILFKEPVSADPYQRVLPLYW